MSTGGVQRLISTNPSAETTTEPNAPDQPEGVELAGGAEHQQRDAGDADPGGHDPGRARPLADDQRGQRHHGQRRGRLQRRGEPAGQPVRREEQQGEEQPDVAHAQQQRPATTSRRDGQAAGGGEQHQAGRQRPQGGREQGPVGRQQPLGDEVRRTPRGGGEGGEEERLARS